MKDGLRVFLSLVLMQIPMTGEVFAQELQGVDNPKAGNLMDLSHFFSNPREVKDKRAGGFGADRDDRDKDEEKMDQTSGNEELPKRIKPSADLHESLIWPSRSELEVPPFFNRRYGNWTSANGAESERWESKVLPEQRKDIGKAYDSCSKRICANDKEYTSASTFLQLIRPLELSPGDWVPGKLDPISNGGFATPPDNGSPVPYSLNGHVDLEKKLPWQIEF